MDHYCRGEIIEKPAEEVLNLFNLETSPDVYLMKVKNGSKINNLVGFAFKKFKHDEGDKVLFSGFGPACSKVLSCAEVMKRTYKAPLHQWTKLSYLRVDEYWEPKDEANPEKLDRLVVKRDIPSVNILLSKQLLCVQNAPGYQAPGSLDLFKSRPDGEIMKRRRRQAAGRPRDDNPFKRPEKTKKGRNNGAGRGGRREHYNSNRGNYGKNDSKPVSTQDSTVAS